MYIYIGHNVGSQRIPSPIYIYIARKPVGGSMDECMGKLPTLLPRATSIEDSAPTGQVLEAPAWSIYIYTHTHTHTHLYIYIAAIYIAAIYIYISRHICKFINIAAIYMYTYIYINIYIYI